jgi:uncharacterized protein (TIGR03118 family)
MRWRGARAAGAAWVGAAVLAASTARAEVGRYAVRNLVSDGAVAAEHVDPNLVNAWGLTALPATPWWVSDNGTGVATLYDQDGVAQPQPTPLVVALPGAGEPAAPTGAAANTTSEFVITLDGTTAPARFLFASEDGTVSAWTRPPPPAPAPTHAVVVVDHASAGAVFKGLALAATPAGARLYATNFHDAVVEVFDGTFAPVTAPGAFVDPGIPAGFAPFGIQVAGGAVYVTYAKQDAAGHDDVAGHGLGFVSAFGLDGAFLRRVASRGKLDSPWGLAIAPPSFGPASGHLLVGNFGDGHIVVFPLDADDAEDRGKYLHGLHGRIEIDGLWALEFGNGAAAGPANVLFFTAGPQDESHGLFGRIDLVAGDDGPEDG